MVKPAPTNPVPLSQVKGYHLADFSDSRNG